MGNIVVGDQIRVVCKMRDRYNSLIENRYFWRHIGTNPVTDAAFLSSLETQVSTLYEYLDFYMPNTLTPVEIEADVVQFSGGKLVTIRSVGTLAWTTWSGGDSGGEVLPEQVAAVVNFTTVVPRTQGRKFFGPLVEGASDNGVVAPALIIELQNFAGPFLASWTIATETFAPGLMSIKTLDLVTFSGANFPVIFGSQRRRKPGVGV